MGAFESLDFVRGQEGADLSVVAFVAICHRSWLFQGRGYVDPKVSKTGLAVRADKL